MEETEEERARPPEDPNFPTHRVIQETAEEWQRRMQVREAAMLEQRDRVDREGLIPIRYHPAPENIGTYRPDQVWGAENFRLNELTAPSQLVTNPTPTGASWVITTDDVNQEYSNIHDSMRHTMTTTPSGTQNTATAHLTRESLERVAAEMYRGEAGGTFSGFNFIPAKQERVMLDKEKIKTKVIELNHKLAPYSDRQLRLAARKLSNIERPSREIQIKLTALGWLIDDNNSEEIARHIVNNY